MNECPWDVSDLVRRDSNVAPHDVQNRRSTISVIPGLIITAPVSIALWTMLLIAGWEALAWMAR